MSGRGLYLGGHAVHLMLVHLPIGLCLATAVWDAMGLVTGEPTWWTLAYFTLALGIISAVPAAVSGVYDYLAVVARNDAALAGRITGHMLSALSAMTLYVMSLTQRTPSVEASQGAPWAGIVLSALAAALLVVAGRQGAQLVLEDGLGRAPAVVEGRRGTARDSAHQAR